MRGRSAVPVSSLLGSLGLHGCVALVVLLAARRPALNDATPARADAWSGNAVEVDALADAEDTPNIANAAGEQPTPTAPAHETPAAEPAARETTAPPAMPDSPPRPPARSSDVPRVEAATRLLPKAQATPKPLTKPNAASGAQAELVPPANETNSGTHEANSSAATGTFGAQGLPPGVSSLPSAFARAIPVATAADPIWQSLPAGKQPPFVLAITVNGDGHITAAQILDALGASEVPLQFEHLRARVVALLGGGVFALKNGSAAGTDQFRISIVLSERATAEDAEPSALVERGFEPPRGNAPGRAYFTLPSGRHFEAKLEVLAQPTRPQRASER